MSTPEEQHADAVEAAHEWRDDEREKHPSLIAALAERFGGLEEVEPGRWYAEKSTEHRGPWA